VGLDITHLRLIRFCAFIRYWRKNGSTMKLKLIYDQQSVGQSVLVSGAHLGPVTNFSFSLKFPLDSCGLLFCSALSDERTGL
jgi:hypothetical protein